MKHYLITFETIEGFDIYAQLAVVAAKDLIEANKWAKQGSQRLAQFDWDEYCKIIVVTEIPEGHFTVLKEYLTVLSNEIGTRSIAF